MVGGKRADRSPLRNGGVIPGVDGSGGFHIPALDLENLKGLDVKRLLKLSTLHVRFPWPVTTGNELNFNSWGMKKLADFPNLTVTTVGKLIDTYLILLDS